MFNIKRSEIDNICSMFRRLLLTPERRECNYFEYTVESGRGDLVWLLWNGNVISLHQLAYVDETVDVNKVQSIFLK